VLASPPLFFLSRRKKEIERRRLDRPHSSLLLFFFRGKERGEMKRTPIAFRSARDAVGHARKGEGGGREEEGRPVSSF